MSWNECGELTVQRSWRNNNNKCFSCANNNGNNAENYFSMGISPHYSIISGDTSTHSPKDASPHLLLPPWPHPRRLAVLTIIRKQLPRKNIYLANLIKKEECQHQQEACFKVLKKNASYELKKAMRCASMQTKLAQEEQEECQHQHWSWKEEDIARHIAPLPQRVKYYIHKKRVAL